ncbi:MAG TPA: tetratricopeptide repeat protein, partial [Actinoplanes sp.]
LGRLSCQLGEHRAAGRYLTESLEMAREFNHPERIAEALTELGLLRAEQGRGEEAVAHVREALALTTTVGARRVETRARHALGLLLTASGDTAAARREYAAALELARAGEDAYARKLAEAALADIGRAAD